MNIATPDVPLTTQQRNAKLQDYAEWIEQQGRIIDERLQRLVIEREHAERDRAEWKVAVVHFVGYLRRLGRKVPDALEKIADQEDERR